MHIELYNADFLNFVEFNITGDDNDYHRCDLESSYLDASVFYLFQPSFENANKIFDYFSGTKYNARKIIVLRNELLNNLKQFENLDSKEAFVSLISSRFMGKEFLADLEEDDTQWSDGWQAYNNKIIKVNQDLIDLVEKCAFDERILWVIGY
jgi:hypothetical protein